jgi:hypothetical protein
MANFGKFTASGYPEDAESLRAEFDKMLEDETIKKNIADAKSLFEGFTNFMRKEFPLEEEKNDRETLCKDSRSIVNAENPHETD